MSLPGTSGQLIVPDLPAVSAQEHGPDAEDKNMPDPARPDRLVFATRGCVRSPGHRVDCWPAPCPAAGCKWTLNDEDDLDEHNRTVHWSRPSLIDEALSYVLLRNAIVSLVNPSGGEAQNPEFLVAALGRLTEHVAAGPCSCGPAGVCGRCAVLGRDHDKRVPR